MRDREEERFEKTDFVMLKDFELCCGEKQTKNDHAMAF